MLMTSNPTIKTKTMLAAAALTLSATAVLNTSAYAMRPYDMLCRGKLIKGDDGLGIGQCEVISYIMDDSGTVEAANPDYKTIIKVCREGKLCEVRAKLDNTAPSSFLHYPYLQREESEMISRAPLITTGTPSKSVNRNKVMLKRTILASALTLATATAAPAASSVPVTITPDESDSCGGASVHLDHGGFLAVRSGPGDRYQLVDKLHDGLRVIFCDQRGDWFGVVYSKTGELTNCDKAIDRVVAYLRPRGRQSGPYRGSCPSGWVHRKYLNDFAG